MKKIIVPVLAFLFLLTGCGSKQTVKCSMSQDTTGMKMESNIAIGLNDSKFDYLKMNIDVNIDKEYLDYKDMLISSLESEFENLEDTYGATVKVNDSSKGAKVEISMDAKQAEKFYGRDSKKVTKKDVVDYFEAQGYSCK